MRTLSTGHPRGVVEAKARRPPLWTRSRCHLDARTLSSLLIRDVVLNSEHPRDHPPNNNPARVTIGRSCEEEHRGANWHNLATTLELGSVAWIKGHVHGACSAWPFSNFQFTSRNTILPGGPRTTTFFFTSKIGVPHSRAADPRLVYKPPRIRSHISPPNLYLFSLSPASHSPSSPILQPSS